jgi:outer membrane lipoprotein SlyB
MRNQVSKLHIALLLLLTLFFQACATTEQEVPTNQLDTSPDIVRHTGEITNIREVKKDASLEKQFGGAFLGSLVGGQIGGGTTSTIMGTAGAFIGQDIANEKYGEVVDRLILTDSEGKEYNCLVHGHNFQVGNKVTFTLVAGHVSAIIQTEPDQ